MSPIKDPKWITGRKGDVLHDTESSIELEHIYEDTETDDEEDDDIPMPTIIKVANKV